jgi:hypothetical protein
LNILSRLETLNASGSRRACRMAIGRNACSLPDFPEFAQAVRHGVPGTHNAANLPQTREDRRSCQNTPVGCLHWPQMIAKLRSVQVSGDLRDIDTWSIRLSQLPPLTGCSGAGTFQAPRSRSIFRAPQRVPRFARSSGPDLAAPHESCRATRREVGDKNN